MTLTEYVLVPKEQLAELIGEVRALTERVNEALDAAAPAPEAPGPDQPHSGFQRFRNRQGGQRG